MIFLEHLEHLVQKFVQKLKFQIFGNNEVERKMEGANVYFQVI